MKLPVKNVSQCWKIMQKKNEDLNTLFFYSIFSRFTILGLRILIVHL
jgi:hypothetical protein